MQSPQERFQRFADPEDEHGMSFRRERIQSRSSPSEDSRYPTLRSDTHHQSQRKDRLEDVRGHHRH